MNLETSRFGALEVDEGQVFNLRRGLIGFPQARRFVVIRPKPSSALVWFQSVDRPDLAFVMANPFLFTEDYRLEPGQGVLKALEAESEADLEVYVLVTIPAGRPSEMTANLIGPIVLNPKTQKGEQLVVENSPYLVKQPLLHADKLTPPPEK